MSPSKKLLFSLFLFIMTFIGLRFLCQIEFGQVDQAMNFISFFASIMVSIFPFTFHFSKLMKSMLVLNVLFLLSTFEGVYKDYSLKYNGRLLSHEAVHKRYGLNKNFYHNINEFSDITNPYSLKHIDEVIKVTEDVTNKYYAQNLLERVRTKEPTAFELLKLKHIPKKFYKEEYLKEEKFEHSARPAYVEIKKDLRKYYEQN